MERENLHAGHRERMRKRFLAADESHTVDSEFEEHELLELLLFYAQPRVNTNETAHRLLRRFGSLHAALEAPAVVLQSVDGIGQNASLLLRLIRAMMRMNVSGENNTHGTFRMTGLSDLVPYIRRMYYAESAMEHVFLMLFGADGTLKKTVHISDGTQTGVSADIPKCVRTAVLYDAASAVLVHNHPSAADPSPEDITLTYRFREAFDAVGIVFSEHLILTDDRCIGILNHFDSRSQCTPTRKAAAEHSR